jgi:hypothetical protein
MSGHGEEILSNLERADTNLQAAAELLDKGTTMSALRGHIMLPSMPPALFC